MTVSDAVKHIVHQLKMTYDEGESTAMADWILEFVTLKGKNEKVVARSASLLPIQVDEINQIIQRLLRNEPLQYILNESWFAGFKFYVDHSVLIPRPETEELVDLVIRDLGKSDPDNSIKILDIGTGSGCIAISIKKKYPSADVWAVDISGQALEVAKKNAALIGADITFKKMNFLSEPHWQRLPVCDLIISNPPYVTSAEKDQMRLNVLAFEPDQALFVPEEDPLVFYTAIAAFGKTHLQKTGRIYCEINETLGTETCEVFNSGGYSCNKFTDMQKKDRFIRAIIQSSLPL